MASVADAPKARKSSKARTAAPNLCSLTLSINGTKYRVRPLAARDFGALRAFRLAKQGGKPAPDGGECVYDVMEVLDGQSCDCPDFTFRRSGLDQSGCKHVKAMRAVGLLSPVVLERKGGAE